METPLAHLGAAEALARLRRGELTAEALTAACLQAIAADAAGGCRAFEHFEPEVALAAARAIDRRTDRPPLLGLPVAVKDIIDTADLPTERGSVAFRGRRPARDAEVVRRLRAAGAVIVGKTVTTELAYYRPGKTTNPHDPARTPGGSSSGSAAGVAACLVPAAVGTQTAGSVIRPASFCGVVGMKTTFGAIPMDGTSPLAPSLDTAGLFVRTAADLPPLLAAAGVPGAVAPARTAPPRLGLCRDAQWALAEPSTRAAVEAVAQRLAEAGCEVEEVEAEDLGPDHAGLAGAQRVIMAAEVARALAEVRAAHGPLLSKVLMDLMDEGARVPPAREVAAREQAARARADLPRLLRPFDALLSASALGEAPLGLGATGDPAMNRVWTLLGTPAVSLPLARGPAGLPLGVQVIGAPGQDGALAATCAWIEAALRA